MARKFRTIVFKADNKGREQIVDLLKKRGFEIIAYDSTEACPLQKSHICQCNGSQACTDILVSDMDLPGSSGLDYVEAQIKKGCKARHIALMSSHWSSSDIRRAEKLGCKIFEKPTRITAFEDWLDACETDLNPENELNNWFMRNTNPTS